MAQYLYKIQYTLLLFIITVQLGTGRECTIEGIPEEAAKAGNVHMLLSSERQLTLELTCKCSLYIPQWHTRKLEVANSDKFIPKPVQCINGTKPCNSNIDYIGKENKSDGLYVFITENFTITENTALMCFSNVDREILIVSFASNNNIATVAPQPTTTSSVGPTSTDTCITTTITNTITQHTTTYTSITSMCSGTGTSTTIKDSTTKTPTVTETPTGDTSVIDGVMQSIGGTSSLVLIPVVVLLIIITTVLCGVVICLRNKTKQRSKQDEVTTDSHRLSGAPLLWRESTASQSSGVTPPKSFTNPLTRDTTIPMHYTTNTNNDQTIGDNSVSIVYPNNV